MIKGLVVHVLLQDGIMTFCKELQKSENVFHQIWLLLEGKQNNALIYLIDISNDPPKLIMQAHEEDFAGREALKIAPHGLLHFVITAFQQINAETDKIIEDQLSIFRIAAIA